MEIKICVPKRQHFVIPIFIYLFYLFILEASRKRNENNNNNNNNNNNWYYPIGLNVKIIPLEVCAVFSPQIQFTQSPTKPYTLFHIWLSPISKNSIFFSKYYFYFIFLRLSVPKNYTSSTRTIIQVFPFSVQSRLSPNMHTCPDLTIWRNPFNCYIYSWLFSCQNTDGINFKTI